MNSKETFSGGLAHNIDLHLNILTPVPEASIVKLMEFICYLFERF